MPKTNKLSATTAILLVIIVACSSAAAQSKVYVSLGIGPDLGGGNGSTFLAGYLNGTLKRQSLVLSSRYVRSAEFKLLSGFGSGGGLTEYFSEFALLAGISSRATRGTSATLEAGIAYVTVGREEIYYEPYDYYGETRLREGERIGTINRAGLALQSQLYFRRVGLTMFADLNRSASSCGFLFCFRFGAMN